MREIHYGVIRQNGVWTIIGNCLRFGAYPTRAAAERAVRRLATLSLGLRVQLHMQDESGELKPPIPIA